MSKIHVTMKENSGKEKAFGLIRLRHKQQVPNKLGETQKRKAKRQNFKIAMYEMSYKQAWNRDE